MIPTKQQVMTNYIICLFQLKHKDYKDWADDKKMIDMIIENINYQLYEYECEYECEYDPEDDYIERSIFANEYR
jgi:hypothetical protein